jgi:hypothetical protein
MMMKDKGLEWLHHRTEEHRVGKSGISGAIEDLEDDGKLGQGFSSVDGLEEIDIGDGTIPRPTYMNAGYQLINRTRYDV